MGRTRWPVLTLSLLLIALGACKIPPWDEIDGSLEVHKPLESAIPWGKTCTIDIYGVPGLEMGMAPRRSRALTMDYQRLRTALTREVAMVGLFKETFESGESDFRLMVEIRELEKSRMSVSVTLQEAQGERLLTSFDVVGYAGPTGDVSIPESTSRVTAFLITVGLDYRRKRWSFTG